MTDLKHISLSQLNSLIGEAIAVHLAPSYWVVAELAEVRENYSGHCYLSLVEKEDDKVLAQSRAAIWQQTYRMIKPYFESATGQVFATGLKVRIKVAVSYHNVYGINLTVQDIDPSYTVGEVIMRRQQILLQLQEDGVAEMNRELEIAEPLQRIAIISSPTAAGYGDFIDQLENNNFGYQFYTHLFPATMQGEGAENSIVEAMGKVFEHIDRFDALVLIRGGGATIDLSCFDNYNIAYHITQFPIPVIVGIGHDRDETVLDLVAHTALKTPTAVAAFLIELLQEVEGQLDILMDRLDSTVHKKVMQESQRINALATALSTTMSRIIANKKLQINQLLYKTENQLAQGFSQQNDRITDLSRRMKHSAQDYFFRSKKVLEKAELVAELSDPRHLFARGYSITIKDGKPVKKSDNLRKGDVITTILHDGKTESQVQ